MSKRSANHTYLPFVSIMLIVGFLVTAVSIGIHYHTSMVIEQEKILEFVENETRLVASVTRFDTQFSNNDNPMGAKEATLSQLLNALKQRDDFSYSGEILLGHRNNLNALTLDYPPPNVTPALSGISEEALELALMGNAGTIFGIDHRGNNVLAAYTYVPDLNRGLVAKIDLEELRRPFIEASLLSIAVSILIILLGSILFSKIQQLETYPNTQKSTLNNHSGIQEYERFFYLIIVMSVISLAVIIYSATTLYLSSYQRSQDHLLHLVRSQENLIESVSLFDIQYRQQDHPRGAKGATLTQIIDAYSQSSGFGKTGEYLLVHRVGDQVKIAFHQRHHEHELKDSDFSFFSNESEFMLLALKGLTGVIAGTDFQGNQVLAAYIPLTHLNHGLIAKIDLAEIRDPYIRGAIISGSIALCIIILASVFLARMMRPFQIQQKLTPFSDDEKNLNPPSIPLNLLLFTLSLALSILILDIITPLGIASGTLYVSVVAVGWWFPQRKHIILLAAFVSILTLVGFYWSPEGEQWKSIINRSYSLFVIWVTALILNLAKASEIARSLQANTLKKLSLAVEFSPTGVIITNPEGYIEYANPCFLNNTEYSEEEVLGESPDMFNSGETPENVFNDMWSTILSGKKWRGEIINRKKSGTLFWEETAIFPILSEQGEVLNFVCLKEDITQKKQIQSDLEHKATHDILTGLPNFHLGKDRLKNCMARARRENNKVAVLFIDLDGFKAVNDTFGHSAGDWVLQEVAIRLRQSIREIDTISRIGGDEFIVIVSDISLNTDIESVANKIINSLKQPFIDIEKTSSHQITIGSSIGIAIYPEHGTDIDQLIKHADAAMYSIKRNGKNSFHFYQSK